MATQRPAVDASLGVFAGQLVGEREITPRAQIIAAEASARLGGIAVVVYLFDANAEPRWTSRASSGDVHAPAQCEALTLATVAEQNAPVLFAGEELVREHYAHLDVRRTVVSLGYVPLLGMRREARGAREDAGQGAREDVLLGAIEAISYDRQLTKRDLAELSVISELSARAIAGALAYESERNSNLDSITRLTQFYDVEKTFHTTLNIDELLPIIAGKTRELLPCAAVNVWMVCTPSSANPALAGDPVEGEELSLMAQDGVDGSLAIGASQDAVIAKVSESGEAVTINDPEDELLEGRGTRGEGQGAGGEGQGTRIRSLAAVPIIDGEDLVGVLECVNKSGTRVAGRGSIDPAEGSRVHTSFDEDDVFLLTTIAETAASAMHNASLLEAERKVAVLQTLVEVSSEITSTLNLERVLQVVVNAPQRIMTYDRAAVALEEHGKLVIKAVSGHTEIVASDPQMVLLREMMEYCFIQEGPVAAIGRPEEIEAERAEDRARFRDYFVKSNARSWYSVPLADDQGRLGVVEFESSDPDAFGEAQMEFIQIVSGQATVAVRNASLYEEVPLIGVLEPLLKKKQEFGRMSGRKRSRYVALAAATAVFLVFFPLPMRVDGAARVSAGTRAQVQAEVPGVVRRVYVREGDRVAAGTVLAELNDWDERAELASAQAKLATAQAAMNRALAANDGMEAGIQRNEAEYWSAEVKRAGERLERTKLRAPIGGVVSTPHIETLVGKKLDVGDNFGEVLNASRATVDVEVDESDVPLLTEGDSAVVKLESFPTRRFKGQVELVSPAGAAVNDPEHSGRVFYARVDVPNAEGLIRPGMEGMSKISTGWRPAGYVLFRGLGMWGWTKLWNWFGW